MDIYKVGRGQKIFRFLLDKLFPSCYSNKGRITQGLSSLGGSILHFNNWIAEGRFKELSQISLIGEFDPGSG